MDIHKERNDFERHWVNYSQCSYQDFYFNAGEYSCENMNDAWRAWIARAKIVPEGFILLPVEPNENILKTLSSNEFNGRMIYKAIIEEAQEST